MIRIVFADCSVAANCHVVPRVGEYTVDDSGVRHVVTEVEYGVDPGYLDRVASGFERGWTQGATVRLARVSGGSSSGQSAILAENASMTTPLLTSDEAAELLAITRHQVARLARRGELPSINLPGGTFRFDSEDIRGWVQSLKRPVVTKYSAEADVELAKKE